MKTEHPLQALSNAMADAAEQAGRSVVMVDARQRMPASGIAYSADLILTADHVVEREEDINVLLPGGDSYPAIVAGRDPGTDLALIKISNSPLQEAKIISEPARIGQLVLALGRPSREGLQASLGVISIVGGPVRTGRGGLLEKYVRTDAIPYPGFSGGPLVDVQGQVVGVNTSGLARGLSLTIPVALAWQVAKTLAMHGSVRRGYLGIRSQPVSIPASQQQLLERSQSTGLLLVGIEDESPAANGGLMVGDILVGLAGTVIDDPDELLVWLSESVVGQKAIVEVFRGGQLTRVSITIGERK